MVCNNGDLLSTSEEGTEGSLSLSLSLIKVKKKVKNDEIWGSIINDHDLFYHVLW